MALVLMVTPFPMAPNPEHHMLSTVTLVVWQPRGVSVSWVHGRGDGWGRAYLSSTCLA
ncbi:hypothetical protein PAXINDRAFT_171397 [Paxillus involutus ATCC 200175]|uniref:Uncharacterized protein n=1 Tax=Paxillus involutus ATCC 200175 TaxID=664439 RepID=A0A0C9STJ1_PAXIN|nr:hypothetical protein PAXINDRAFT_171397 [Paxillus involutus ATCC 200175]